MTKQLAQEEVVKTDVRAVLKQISGPLPLLCNWPDCA